MSPALVGAHLLVSSCAANLVLRDLSRVRLTVRLRNCLGASLLSVVQPQCSRPLLRLDVFLLHPLSVVPAQLHVSHNQFPADPIHDGVVSFLSIAASPSVFSGARVLNCSVHIRSPSSAYYPVLGSSSSYRRCNTPSRSPPSLEALCADAAIRSGKQKKRVWLHAVSPVLFQQNSQQKHRCCFKPVNDNIIK